MKESGIITDIQRFSLDDGPGIRTTVFFKGCNLRCRWCHNPETMAPDPQLRYVGRLCVGCGTCVLECPRGVHHISEGRHILEWEKCDVCGACVNVCLAGALSVWGRETNVDIVMETIMKDRSFYRTSDGGVTLSGGEPLLQPEFLANILKACRVERIHTALDTAAHVDWDIIESVIDNVDLFLIDCKFSSTEKHMLATGVTNTYIMDNIRRIGATGKHIWIRIPVVQGYQTDDEIHEINRFLADVQGIEKVELLPYHVHGTEKYQQIGLTPYAIVHPKFQ